MTYSCAVIEHEGEPLAHAQRRKLRMVCDKLELGPDDHVLEIGCGWGSFALTAAGEYGARVTGITLSPAQAELARRRIAAAGLADRIEARLAGKGSLGVDDLAGKVDLVLAFAVLHELPDLGRFFAEVRRTLAPGGQVLVAEPSGHVSGTDFEATLAAAVRAGFRRETGPAIRRSITAVLA